MENMSKIIMIQTKIDQGWDMMDIDDVEHRNGDMYSRRFDLIASTRPYEEKALNVIIQNTKSRGFRIKSDGFNSVVTNGREMLDILFNSKNVYYMLPKWRKLIGGRSEAR